MTSRRYLKVSIMKNREERMLHEVKQENQDPEESEGRKVLCGIGVIILLSL